MPKVFITKHSAAQRQLDAAIRWLFAGEDALPIHTVGAAAYEVLRDLAKTRGRKLVDNILDDSVLAVTRNLLGRVPEREEIRRIRLWSEKVERRPANFLKHADHDPSGVLDADTLETDYLLLKATVTYIEIGFPLTKEMQAFVRWHCAVYPNEAADELTTASGPLHKLSREAQIKFGEIMLEIYRRE